jgi:hypothetical protein
VSLPGLHHLNFGSENNKIGENEKKDQPAIRFFKNYFAEITIAFFCGGSIFVTQII